MHKLPIIGVMGASTAAWAEYAVPLGRHIAGLQAHLLTGGGAGVMTSVAEAFTSVQPRAGLSIGCLPTLSENEGFQLKPGYPNPYIEIPIVTPLNTVAAAGSMLNRNYVNILTSDIIIALPGNSGTLNEAELALRFGKPIILFGPTEAFATFPAELTRYREMPPVIDWIATHLKNLAGL